MEQPKPLGYVMVATPGTPVRATVNEVDPTMRLPAQAFYVQAHPGNVGMVYVRVATGADDRTALRRTIGILPIPGAAGVGPFAMLEFRKSGTTAGFNMADIYIDADSAEDGAIITCVDG